MGFADMVAGGSLLVFWANFVGVTSGQMGWCLFLPAGRGEGYVGAVVRPGRDVLTRMQRNG